MTVKLNLIDRKKTRNLKACHTSAEERLLRRRLAHSKRSSERARVGHVGCVVSSPRLQVFRTAAKQSPAAGATQQQLLRQCSSTLPCSRFGSASGDFLTPGGVGKTRKRNVVHVYTDRSQTGKKVCVTHPAQVRCFPLSLNLNDAHILWGGRQTRFNSSAGFSAETERHPILTRPNLGLQSLH
jgi:hypothetical protein